MAKVNQFDVKQFSKEGKLCESLKEVYIYFITIYLIKLFDRYIPKCVNLPNRDRT